MKKYTDTGLLIKHGKVISYATYGCRCDKCTEANTEYRKKKREENLKISGMSYTIHKHGLSGYAAGCVCKKCRKAYADYYEDLKARNLFLRKTIKFEDIPHGKQGYKIYKCRCETCKEAQYKYARELYKKKK